MNWDDLTPVDTPKEGPKWDDLEPVSAAPSYTDLAKSKATEGLGNIGDMREWALSNLPKGLQDYARTALKFNPVAPQVGMVPTSEQLRNATGVKEVQPQGWGQQAFGGAVSAATNPLSYVGAGGLGLKALGAAAGGAGGAVGGELGGTAGRELGSEAAGRLVGSTLGGLAGGFGAHKIEKAGAPPTGPQLPRAPSTSALQKDEDLLWTKMRGADVSTPAASLADWATKAHGEISGGPKYAFTPARAPGAFSILEDIKKDTNGPHLGPERLNTIRQRINDVAKDTVPDGRGGSKPTPDAKAAMVLKRSYMDFLQNDLPATSAGKDVSAFRGMVGRANKATQSLTQVEDAERRINNAQVNVEGGSGQLNKQLSAQFRPIAKNVKEQRGLTPEQIAAAGDVNRTGAGGGFLQSLPARILFHGVPAFLSHGFSAPATLGLESAVKNFSGNRAMAAAQNYRDLAAKQSPLYQGMLNNVQPPPLPQPGMSPLQSQLLRSAVTGLQNGR